MKIPGAAFRLDVVFSPVVTVLMYLPVILLIRRAKRKQEEARKREKDRKSPERKEKP